MLLDAVCGLLVILSAQFGTNEAYSSNTLSALGEPQGNFRSGIGDFFLVKFPDDWPDELKYDFDWNELATQDDPFEKFNYDLIK